jgi:hypothetical protein
MMPLENHLAGTYQSSSIYAKFNDANATRVSQCLPSKESIIRKPGEICKLT